MNVIHRANEGRLKNIACYAMEGLMLDQKQIAQFNARAEEIRFPSRLLRFDPTCEDISIVPEMVYNSLVGSESDVGAPKASTPASRPGKSGNSPQNNKRPRRSTPSKFREQDDNARPSKLNSSKMVIPDHGVLGCSGIADIVSPAQQFNSIWASCQQLSISNFQTAGPTEPGVSFHTFKPLFEWLGITKGSHTKRAVSTGRCHVSTGRCHYLSVDG